MISRPTFTPSLILDIPRPRSALKVRSLPFGHSSSSTRYGRSDSIPLQDEGGDLPSGSETLPSGGTLPSTIPNLYSRYVLLLLTLREVLEVELIDGSPVYSCIQNVIARHEQQHRSSTSFKTYLPTVPTSLAIILMVRPSHSCRLSSPPIGSLQSAIYQHSSVPDIVICILICDVCHVQVSLECKNCGWGNFLSR